MLEEIGDSMPNIDRYAKLFATSVEVQGVVSKLYIELFEFVRACIKTFKTNSSLWTLTKTLFTPLLERQEELLTTFRKSQSRLERIAASQALVVDKEEYQKAETERVATRQERDFAEQERVRAQLAREAEKDFRNWSIENKTASDTQANAEKWRGFIASPPTPTVQHKHELSRQVRYQNTDDWFLNTKEFQDWVQKKSSFLWLSGIPVAGKTILVSQIIDFLQSQSQSHILAYFYCDFRDDTKRESRYFVGSLLRQLLNQIPMIAQHSRPPAVQRLFDIYHKQNSEGTTADFEFHEALQSILQVCAARSQQIIIVVDALDEADLEGHRTILDDIRDIYDLSGNTVRLFVSGRDIPDIHALYGDLPRRDIKECDISGDISAYVTGEIERRLKSSRRSQRLRLRDPVLKHEVVDHLVECARRMFMWARCQLDSLCEQKSDAGIRNALMKLPKDLKQTYDSIIIKIKEQKEEDAQLAWRILQYVTFSARPLTLGELACAIAMVPGEYDPDDSAIVTEFEDILDLCKNLIALEEEARDDRYHSGQKVMLSHFSVKEYLISDSVLDPLQCHHLLADLCLMSLGLNSFLKKDWINVSACLAKSESLQRLIPKCLSYAFIEYSTEYWYIHMKALSKASVDVLESTTEYFLRAFSSKSSCEFLAKHQILYGTTPLCICIIYRLDSMFEALISRGIDPNGISPYASSTKALELTPLCVAISENAPSEYIITRLLDSGGGLTEASGKQTLLHVAQLGRKNAMRFLLEFGVKPDWSVMEYAIKNNEFGLLEFLLQHVSLQDITCLVDSNGRTLLHVAATVSAIAYNMLAGFGMSVDITDKNGITPRMKLECGLLEVIPTTQSL